jgi:hypothetical protein
VQIGQAADGTAIAPCNGGGDHAPVGGVAQGLVEHPGAVAARRPPGGQRAGLVGDAELKRHARRRVGPRCRLKRPAQVDHVERRAFGLASNDHAAHAEAARGGVKVRAVRPGAGLGLAATTTTTPAACCTGKGIGQGQP